MAKPYMAKSGRCCHRMVIQGGDELKKNNIMGDLSKNKIIAIVRGISQSAANQTAEALMIGGIKFVEVTLNTEGALHIIKEWKKRFSENLYVGAGTVIDLEMAKQAIDAGAQYLVTPNLDEEVIAYALSQHVEIFPGTMTPTEVVRAWKCGAKAVKVFPTGVLGAEYIKELQGPLEQIKMIATGGVNLSNIGQFLDAGAFGVGLGNNLVNKDLIQTSQFDKLSDLAKQYTDAVKKNM